MSTILRPKHSQSEMKISAFLFQNTYFVDDAITGGMKIGFFAGLKSDGVSGGIVAPTIEYANAVVGGKKASGFIYESSKRWGYDSTANWENEIHLFPKGYREDKAIGMQKYGVIEISGQTGNKYRHFPSVDTLITSLTQVNALNEIKGANGKTFFVVKKLASGITVAEFVTGALTANVVCADVAALVALTGASPKLMGQMDKPVYLAPVNVVSVSAANTAAAMESVGMNFVTWPTEQCVGYVESPISIRVDLRCDPTPAPFATAINAATGVLLANAEELAGSVAYANYTYEAKPGVLGTV